MTPNVDHAVMFHERADLRSAYESASLVLADGFPVVLASKVLGSAAAGTRCRERLGAGLVRVDDRRRAD